MSKNIETERRWLIDPNLSKEAWRNLKLNRPEGPLHTTQNYLIPVNNSVRRLRYQAYVDNNKFFSYCMLTIKSPVQNSKFSFREEESFISMEKYLELLHEKDPSTKSIYKERWELPRNDEDDFWELDIFKGRHEGLVILEAELSSEDELVTPPTYLNIIKEITGLKEYSNYELAKK